MYKSFLIIVCAILMLGSSRVYSQVKPTITLGYFKMKPYAYQTREGAATGAAIDFLQNHIAKEMNVQFKFVKMPLAKILLNMSNGTIDGIVILGYTKERAEKHFYPQNSMQKSNPVLTVLNDSVIFDLPTDRELTDLRIGYVKDAILTDYLARHAESLDLIYGDDTWVRNVERLLERRVDAIYAALRANMICVVSDTRAADKVRIVDIKSDSVELYTIFSAHPTIKTKKLKKSYDYAFNKIDGKLVFDSIFNNYTKDC